jgi:1,4-alpha-glucan branching enzyme/maltooligosyltrehalose trehalohydrolase
MPFGTEMTPAGARFRLWAPAAKRVDLALGRRLLPMQRREDGWFERLEPDAAAGTLYRYRIDGESPVPDPASRFQPKDVDGPSEVVDPSAFAWEDAAWRGRPWAEAVIYELHVGAFSAQGNYAGVRQRLPQLRELGVTAIELMPIADFAGKRNWGYDGVLPYAPDSAYGRPEQLKQLVQAAHAEGLMVFLDVVYNHFGPKGNYLRRYAPQFFTDRVKTPYC